ncbi:MAG: hypothetical protein J6D34_08370, partial [Atopobiaceae bacterium]|nr:hypothetical protein [Atopobiaceae bacterium]
MSSKADQRAKLGKSHDVQSKKTRSRVWGIAMKNARFSKVQKREMKEGFNKFLSVLLTFAMVLQTSPVAYARMDEGGADAYVTEAPVPDEAVTEEIPAAEEEVFEEEVPAEEAPAEEVVEPVEEAVEPDVAPVEEQPVEEEQVKASIAVYVENATLTAGEDSLANTSGTIEVPEGEALAFTVTPAEGYELKDDSVKVIVDGNEMAMPADGSYLLDASAVKTGTQITVVTKKIPVERVYKYEDGDVRVTATLDEASAIPDDAVLSVTPIYENSTYYNYDAYMQALNDTVEGEGVYDNQNTLLYDVAFLWVDPETGKTVELQPEEGAVTVKFTFRQRQLSEGLEAGSAANVEVNHLPLVDSAKADTTYESTNIGAGDVIVEPMGSNATGANTVEVRTDTFSVFAFSYTVDFTYDGYTYKLEGDGSIMLSEILAALGIDVNMADIANVEFTNYDLLAFEKQGDDWKITSLKSFDTPEKLTITLQNGDKYEIGVTDPPGSQGTQLSRFLSGVTVTGATENADGSYMVTKGQSYAIEMVFSEDGPGVQFDNPETLTYQLPSGVDVINDINNQEISVEIQGAGGTIYAKGHFSLDTNGNLTVNFDTNDPNYRALTRATNVSFKIKYNAEFEEDTEFKNFNGEVIREVDVKDPDPGTVSVNKNGTFNKDTLQMEYTVTVSCNGGDVSDVKVADTITGDALTFSGVTSVTSSKGGTPTYTQNSATNGFDYTFDSMTDGETITIKYTADVNIAADTDGDGKIEASQTGNKVKVTPPTDQTPPEQNFSNEITYRSTNKSNGTDGGTTPDGDKIVNWTVTYNSECIASAANSTIKDTINANSTDYMKYYNIGSDSGITIVVKDKNGNTVRTDQVGTNQLTAYSNSSWTYTIPSSDNQPYSYEVSYQTVVDMKKVNEKGNVTLDNDSNNNHGSYEVKSEVEVKKGHTTANTGEITWVLTVHVPASGLSNATIVDTLPTGWIDNVGYIDAYEAITDVTGLVGGETYSVVTGQGSNHNELAITFYTDSNKTTEGFNSNSTARDVVITLKTKPNAEWINYGFEHWGTSTHQNQIGFNGKQAQDTVVLVKPGFTKSGPSNSENSKDTILEYSLLLTGVTAGNFTIQDAFDTSILEYYAGSNPWELYEKICGGGQYDQQQKPTAVTITPTGTGATIDVGDLPMQDDGTPYEYYRIRYRLKLKDGKTLKDIAIDNNGEKTITNTATWNGQESEYSFTTKFKPSFTKSGPSDVKNSTEKTLSYTLTLYGVHQDSFTVSDKFDTSLLDNQAVTNMFIYGGNDQNNYVESTKTAVTASAEANGITINVTNVPKTSDNKYYDYYKIVYDLTLKDDQSLAGAAASDEDGELEIENTAGWDDLESEYSFKTKYEPLDKQLINDGEIGGTNRTASYKITFNPAAAELFGGHEMELVDTLSKNLNLDASTIVVVGTDASGASVEIPYTIDFPKDESGKVTGETKVTYNVPDSTSVVITYDATVMGTGKGIEFSNTAVIGGYRDTEWRSKDMGASGEGTGSLISLKVLKVDGYNANKKLAGVQFKFYAADGTPVGKVSEDAETATVTELYYTTGSDGTFTIASGQPDDNGVYADLYDKILYKLEEVQPIADYNPLDDAYDYTFTYDSNEVDHQDKYVYYFIDNTHIENWPIEGLVVEKQVVDADGNDADDDTEFSFTVTASDAEGNLLNGKVGDDTFTNGEFTFTLRSGESKQFWGFKKGYSYKVVENLTDAQGNTYSTDVTYDVIELDDEGNVVSRTPTLAEDTTEHEGDLTSGTYETVKFTNKLSSGSLKIQKAVTENGAVNKSDAAKSKLAGDYTFTVYTDKACTKPLQKDNADVTVTLTVPADGSSVTSQEITDIPAGTYYVKETSPTTANPSPVTNPVEVTVEAGKTGDATVIATVTNDYKHVEAAPEVTKSINVWPESVNSFDFTLTAGTNTAGVTTPMPVSGGESASATSDARTATFGSITFEKAGTYNYTIKEDVPEDDDPGTAGVQKDGVTYVETEYPVQIVVGTDSTTGQLTTPVITYGAALNLSNLTVNNTYDASGEAVISAMKAANDNLGDTEFTFELTKPDGTKLTKTAKQGETVSWEA